MRLITKIVLTLVTMSTIASACGNIFINKGGFHVEARSMEFGYNMASSNVIRFIGQKQTSNILLNLDKIPTQKILSWEYKNGFVGRADTWRPGMLMDGMNTKGVSVSFLYAPGITTYPEYNNSDKRKVINAFDIPTYILSTASSTDDAVRKLKNLQILNAVAEVLPGQYFKNIPMHLSIRDKSGKSAVVEWIDGKTVINISAKNVMTNSPSYPQQLKNAAKYSSLKVTNTKVNKKFENRVIDYKFIFNMKGSRSEQTALMGLPADFTPPSRFVRATVLLDNMITPSNSTHARMQATEIIGTVATIGIDTNDLALWYVVKDLDNLVFYSRNAYFYQALNKVTAYDPAVGYEVLDLKTINFKMIPLEWQKEYKALSPQEAKKLKITDMLK